MKVRFLYVKVPDDSVDIRKKDAGKKGCKKLLYILKRVLDEPG